MSSLAALLSSRVEAVTGIDPELRPATRPQFGHYQSNVALRLANTEGKPPREIAAHVIAKLEIADLCEPPEIAGHGFINFRLRTDVLAQAVTDQLADPTLVCRRRPTLRCGDRLLRSECRQADAVGHLRSTIIGDCLRRVLIGLWTRRHRAEPCRRLGYQQFGMLVEQILDERLDPAVLDLSSAEAVPTGHTHFKADPNFAERARRRVVLLQTGDPETLAIWQQLIDISFAGFDAAYARLGYCSPMPIWRGRACTTTTLHRWSRSLSRVARQWSTTARWWCSSRVSTRQ